MTTTGSAEGGIPQCWSLVGDFLCGVILYIMISHSVYKCDSPTFRQLSVANASFLFFVSFYIGILFQSVLSAIAGTTILAS